MAVDQGVGGGQPNVERSDVARIVNDVLKGRSKIHPQEWWDYRMSLIEDLNSISDQDEWEETLALYNSVSVELARWAGHEGRRDAPLTESPGLEPPPSRRDAPSARQQPAAQNATGARRGGTPGSAGASTPPAESTSDVAAASPETSGGGVWEAGDVRAWADQVAAHFGLQVTSHTRDEEHNRSVGGADNSDHLWGGGVDFGGSEQQMDQLADWLNANSGDDSPFRLVLWRTSGHNDHVHLSFKRNVSTAAPLPDGDSAYTPQGQTVEGVPSVAAGDVDVQAAGDDTGEEPQITPAAAPSSVSSGALGLSVPQVDDAVASLGDEELVTYLEENYGYLTWALNIPDIRPILLDMARGNITDPDKAFGQIYATGWWQNTEGSIRQWDALAGQDPTGAKAQVRQVWADLRNYAARLGVPATRDRLWMMARDALRLGWVQAGQSPESSSQLRNALLAEANRVAPSVDPEAAAVGDEMAMGSFDTIRDRVQQMFANRGIEAGSVQESADERYDRIATSIDSGELTLQEVRNSLDLQLGFQLESGDITATADALQTQAEQYLVPVSDSLAQDWAMKIARGEASKEGFSEYLRSQAASLFAGNESIQQALDQGLSVRQWADPYVQMTARTLEIAPDSIDLAEPKFLEGIHQVDTNSGVSGPMSLSDYQRYLRGLPEWRSTQNAVDSSSEMIEFLGEKMGAL